MFKSILAVAVIFTFAFAATVHAADADQKKMASKDTKFINNAAAGGQMEVDLGNLAKDKASSDDVNMSPSARSSSRNRAVCAVTRRASGSPVRRAQCAYARSSSALS